MAEEEDPTTAWEGVYCHRPYNPYRFMGSRNPAFTRADGRLLDFKYDTPEGIKGGVADFITLLSRLDTGRGTVLVIVPGHEASPSNAGKPLAKAAEQIAAADDRYVAKIDALIRTTTIEKLAKGGDRELETHLRSIGVQDPASLSGATVIILDDTVTSGNSIEASRTLLKSAGAANVAAIALGRTVKYL